MVTSSPTPPSAGPKPSEEDVARAIYEAHGFAFEGRTILADGTPYAAWAKAVTAARAVLDLFAPVLAENAELKTTRGAARAWCLSKGIKPDFHWDGRKTWQNVALIDVTAEELKAALAEEEDDHRKTEARALAAEAALASARETAAEIDRLLMSMQPHIPQALQSGRADFIDNYVEAIRAQTAATRARGE